MAEPSSLAVHEERRGHGPAAQCAGALLSPPCGRRLQRPRRKGYKTPPGVIYAGRPAFLCNPFERRRGRNGRPAFGHALAFKLHRRWLLGEIAALGLGRLGFSPAEIDALARRRARILRALPALVGRDIECWCALTCRFCHVDTVIELAAASLDRGLAAAH